MMAVTGSIPNVVGKRMEMVAEAPIPGKTPIRVPINTPMKQKRRFCSVSAIPKPWIRLAKISICQILKKPWGSGCFNSRSKTR